MTKYTVSNDQVPHLWANQSQSHAKGYGSISFRGTVLYSYAATIGNLVQAVDGSTVALLISRKWSATTSQHQSGARQAVYHLPHFTVPNIEGGKNDDNLAYLVKQYQDALASLRRMRSMPTAYAMADLHDRAHHARDYAAKFGLPAPAIDIADQAAVIAYHNTPEKLAKRAAKEALEAASREAEIAAARDKLRAWRAGASVYLPTVVSTDAEGGALIRIIGDELQTSQGATVPLADAVKVFHRVAACRAAGITWHRNGEMICVGGFHVDHIYPDGSFKAGCHRFNWPEIEAAAKRAGVMH